MKCEKNESSSETPELDQVKIRVKWNCTTNSSLFSGGQVNFDQFVLHSAHQDPAGSAVEYQAVHVDPKKMIDHYKCRFKTTILHQI